MRHHLIPSKYKSCKGSSESTGKTPGASIEDHRFGFMQVLGGKIPAWTDGETAFASPARHFLDIFPGDHAQPTPERIILYTLCEIKPILFKSRPIQTRREDPETKLTP